MTNPLQSEREALTEAEIVSIYTIWDSRPGSTHAQLIADCYALGRQRALASRTPSPAPEGAAEPVRCALCWNNARIPPICDACHDDMGTRPKLASPQPPAASAVQGALPDDLTLEALRVALTLADVPSAYRHEIIDQFNKAIRARAALASQKGQQK